jgi:transposase
MKVYLSYTKQDRKHTVCLSWRNFAFKKKRWNYAGFFTKGVISMELEQRYVITFLRDFGKDGAEIHSIFMEHYGKDSNRKTAVYYWIKEVKQGRTDLTDKEAPGKPLDEDLAAVIQRQHEEGHYLSARRIAKTVGVALSTVCRYLHQYLGLNCRHTKWVPHSLTDDLKN